MGNAVTSLKAHHAELLQLAQQIVAALDGQDPAARADELRVLFTRLLGRLEFHLRAEDEHLYPVLLQHPHERVRSMAEGFIAELGGLASAVDGYKTRWRSTTQILGDPERFAHELRVLVAALGKRIDREENELFPLVAS